MKKKCNKDVIGCFISAILPVVTGMWLGILLMLPYTYGPDYLSLVAGTMGFIAAGLWWLDNKKEDKK